MLQHKVRVCNFVNNTATYRQNNTDFFLFYQIQTISWTVTTKGPEQITSPERMMTFTMEGKTKHDFSNSISLSKIAFVF